MRFYSPQLEKIQNKWPELRTKKDQQKFIKECKDLVKKSTEVSGFTRLVWMATKPANQHAKQLDGWQEFLRKEAAAQVAARKQERFQACVPCVLGMGTIG